MRSLLILATAYLLATPALAAVPELGPLDEEPSYTARAPEDTLVLLCSGPIVAAVVFQGQVILINEVYNFEPANVVAFADSIQDLGVQAVPCALYLKSFGTGHQ